MRYIDADKINYLVWSLYNGHDMKGNTLFMERAIAFESDIDEMPDAEVVPKEVIKEIFEEIFFSENYRDGELVVTHDNLVKIKNKYNLLLKL